MKFNRRQKDGLAKVFLNLAQVDAITLIIGNIALADKFSWLMAITGGILFVLFLSIGAAFNGGD